MKAIDRFINDASRHSLWFSEIMSGAARIYANPRRYGVTAETFRRQARERGFKTRISGSEILIYKERVNEKSIF